MFSKLEWLVAFRYLRARRDEGFISVIAWFSLIGIVLGVATLIIVMAVMNGFRQDLLSRILGIDGHIRAYGAYNTLKNYEGLTLRVSAIGGVLKVTPMIEGQAMVAANGQASGAVIKGLRLKDLYDRPMISKNVVAGEISEFAGNDAVLIGRLMAKKFNIMVGDKITLISPKGNVTAFGTIPRMRSYTVRGIFDIGMHRYDSLFVFMPLTASQKYFRTGNSVNYLDVLIDDPEDTNRLSHIIKSRINGAARTVTWQNIHMGFFNAIQVERNVMFLILTLIILVAAFNIVSSLIMLVKDKARDIAILRTMGATQGMIMRIFFISGASIGTIGTIIGFGVGLVFSLNIETIRQWIQGMTGTELFAAEIYFLSQLPAVVDPTEVFAIVLMGLVLSLIATIYPSFRASRVDPIEILRYG